MTAYLSPSLSTIFCQAGTAEHAAGLGGSCIHTASLSNCHNAGTSSMPHARVRWLQHSCLCSCHLSKAEQQT
jgi:hypothetical protein